ncbi:hypothetical protein PV05_01075 [Exophiala xenobiotica]|uniref:Uncharacterized protein n=1 Tax=Exophiala xenobiotica TaxID=348802 RepID=A0A0D2FL74_9EURO|nr:uncharacterized protein PV05_01075 [Exophiala xenobiotica]KIW60894.1 hypothetical protein PV05_01075 [Exophiala xenobiotica]
MCEISSAPCQDFQHRASEEELDSWTWCDTQNPVWKSKELNTFDVADDVDCEVVGGLAQLDHSERTDTGQFSWHAQAQKHGTMRDTALQPHARYSIFGQQYPYLEVFSMVHSR